MGTSYRITLLFNPVFKEASDFDHNGLEYKSVVVSKEGESHILSYVRSGTEGSNKNMPGNLGLLAKIILLYEYGKLDQAVEGIKGALSVVMGGTEEKVEALDHKLSFTSVTVENLNNIFGVYSRDLSLHVLSRILSMDREKFNSLKGKSKKWIKSDHVCAIYFPRTGKDDGVGPTTPTYNRFCSYFGKKWGKKQTEINSSVVSAIGLSFGWHGLLTKEGLDIIKSKFEFTEKDNKWVIYTASITKCRPVKEWNMAECEQYIILAYSLFNELKASNKHADFLKKTWTALKVLGAEIRTEKFFDFASAICPVLNKHSGGGATLPEGFMERLVWMKENVGTLYSSNSSVSIGMVTDTGKLKEGFLNWKGNNSQN